MKPVPTRMIKAAVLAAAMALAPALPAPAQAPAPKPAGPPPTPLLRVFLDWPGADIEAVRSDVPFAELVTSLDAADVHVTVTPRPPAPQEAYAIEIRGLKRFQGEDNALSYVAAAGEKPEDVRKGIAGIIELGLLRYAAKTPLAKDLSVRFLDQAKPTAVNDPWNF